MATLSISIDLSQVQQAQGQFEALMGRFHLHAMTGILRIQSEFDKGVKLTGFERSLQTFIKLMSEFEAYANITFQYVRQYFAMRPNLQGFRDAYGEFKGIVADFEREGKQMARNIAKPFAAGGRTFTPVIDIQRVKTSEKKFGDSVDTMHTHLERVINRMIREWNKYLTVVNEVIDWTRFLVRELKQAFDALGPIGTLARAVSAALRAMGQSARSAGTGVKDLGGGLKNVVITVGDGVVVTDNFNRKLNGTKVAARAAQTGIHDYRDSLLGLFFLIDTISISRLWDKVKVLGKDLMANQMTMDSTMATLRSIFGSAEQAAIEFERVRASAESRGLNTLKMAEQWARASAAAKGSPLFGRVSFELFEGISSMAAVMGKDPVLAFKALVDMLGKNQITMEDLRQQLAEHLPGALQIFKESAKEHGTSLELVAKNTGTGFGKMNAVMETSAQKMKAIYDPEAAKNANRLRGSTEGLTNAWEELLQTINTGGFNQALVGGIQALTALLREPATLVAMRAFGKALGEEIPKAVRAITPALKLLRDNFGLVLEAILLLTAALTGAMKGGLVGLALAPFTGGASIPVGAGIGAAAAVGVGLGLTRGIPDELLTVFDGIVIAGKMLVWVFNQLYEQLVHVRLAFEAITYVLNKLTLDNILGNLGGVGILYRLGKIGQLAEGQKPGEVSGVASISGGAKGIIDEYYKALADAAAEQEKVRLAQEEARKKLLPHMPPGPGDDTINPEVAKAQKRADSFVEKMQAQTREMQMLRSEVETAMAQGITQDSREWGIIARTAELLRQADTGNVERTDAVIQSINEAAIAVENTTRFIKTLEGVEAEELATKELSVIATNTFSERLVLAGVSVEDFTEFVKTAQAVERGGLPLDDILFGRLKRAVMMRQQLNREIETGISLTDRSRDSLMEEAEADLRTQMRHGGRLGIASGEENIPGVPRPMALARLQAWHEELRKNPLAGSMTTTIKNEDGTETAGVSAKRASDIASDRVVAAQQANQVTDTIDQLRAETTAQITLQEVLNLNVRAREREIAYREKINQLTADGKVLLPEQTERIREMTDALVDQQETTRNMYGPLKKFAEEFSNDIENMQNAITGAFESAEDAIAEFAATGKFEVGDMIESMIRDFTKLALRQAITGPLANMLNQSLPTSGEADKINWGKVGSGIMSWAGKLFGGGAGAGAGAADVTMGMTSTPSMPLGGYYGGIVPSYAFGGIAGVDTVHAMVTPGEGIFTANQMRHLAPADPDKGKSESETPVVINATFNFPNSDAESFRRSSGQIEARLANSAKRATQRLR